MKQEEILQQVKDGRLSIEEASTLLKGIEDIGYAAIDLSRQKRNGFPEIIYGEGKNIEQLIGIISAMNEHKTAILATRVNAEKGEALKLAFPEGVYEPLGRTFVLNPIAPKHEHYIAVVTAGTSDIPVAEEAAVTAETFGNHVKRIYDVGVAGIHRLFNRLEDIQGASVVIVIAGMEGALVSVVGGLVDVPVIAVPTSIGYGTNLQGVTTLLSMLTSCASGVTVVNIDNGFGAAYSASMINNIRGGLA